MIQLDEVQRDFIMMACNLYDAVIQFDITDKDFLEDYGYTKQDFIVAVNKLKNLL